MQITVDEDRCIGSGQCVMTAPQVFDQRDDDGIVLLLQSTPSSRDKAAVTHAALLCPAAAIRVIQEHTS